MPKVEPALTQCLTATGFPPVKQERILPAPESILYLFLIVRNTRGDAAMAAHRSLLSMSGDTTTRIFVT